MSRIVLTSIDPYKSKSVAPTVEKRAVSVSNAYHPKDPALVDWFSSGNITAAGTVVTPEEAFKLSPVFACITVLAETIAMLPLCLYKQKGVIKRRVTDAGLSSTLSKMPNRWQTAFEFWQMMVGLYLLWGNSYAYVSSTGGNSVSELIPLNPTRMRVFVAPNGYPAYEYSKPDGSKATYLAGEILHLRDFTTDGYVGVSRIYTCAETFGLSMATDDFGSRFFSNGTALSGVLTHPSTLNDVAYERLRKSWADRYTGVVNAYKPALLEDGLDWKPLSVKPDEAQFLETRKHQVLEACRVYRVPPHMIASLEGATYSNIEEQSMGFAQYSILPHTARIEQAVYRDVFSSLLRKDHHVKFDLKTLLRSNSEARSKYYKELFYMGALSSNDIREMEDLNPREGGDVYYIPVNMAPSDKKPEEPSPTSESPGTIPNDPEPVNQEGDNNDGQN